MKEFLIGADGAGKRLDRYLEKLLPALSLGQRQKYLRLKRFRVNGKVAKGESRLAAGDSLACYIGDECFDKPPEAPDPFYSRFRARPRVVYEDENILLSDKPAGLLVHPDAEEKIDTLLNRVRAYLYQKGCWKPSAVFSPVPVNRIDRFTSGLVLFALTEQARDLLLQKLRDRELDKLYLLAVRGRPRPEAGVWENFLLNEDDKGHVRIVNAGTPGAKKAVTRYETLASAGGLSLLRCGLITGRTHQIRAQAAGAGHPIVGDPRYGDRALNEKYGPRQQALCAWGLRFSFQTDAGALNYLKDRAFYCRAASFVGELFPDFDLSSHII